MKKQKEFQFENSRRVTREETSQFKKAIEKKTGMKRSARGRPPKPVHEKFEAISIRLNPLILAWAKNEAKRQGIGYQTVINEFLLKKIAA